MNLKKKQCELLRKCKAAAHKRERARRDLRRAAVIITPEEYRRARALTGCGLNALKTL
jgi:hypothetical protein